MPFVISLASQKPCSSLLKEIILGLFGVRIDQLAVVDIWQLLKVGSDALYSCTAVVSFYFVGLFHIVRHYESRISDVMVGIFNAFEFPRRAFHSTLYWI